MQYKTAALFAVGLASSAAATGWLDQDAYSSPSNTDNQCSDKQQGGYDWSGLQDGQFESYGSNKFSGFSCGNSFGKRDLLTKRTFQSKCIQGNLDEEPSMSCEGDDDKFSIDEFEVSTSEDADVECHYSMPDGSTCKETHACSSGGNVIKNTQCGGARSVTFRPGKSSSGRGCQVGVHSVGFECNPGPSSVPASTPTPSISSYVMTPGYTSKTAETTSSAACGHGDEDCSSSATPSSPVSESAPAPSCAYGEEGCEGTSSAPATTATPGYTSRCSHGEDCESSATPSSPVTLSSVPVSSAPAPSCAYGDEDCSATPSSPASSSVPIESSSAPAPSCAYGDEDCDSETTGVPGYTQKTSSTENSPVGSTSIPSYGVTTSSAVVPVPSSSAPYPISSSSPSIPAYGTGSVSSSTENSPVSSSSVPEYPEPSCPGVLPKCLKTWLHVTECKDSGDSECFCGNDEFIKNVHACLPAWADDDEASAAASYLMGLCAPQIPSNPGIITHCPSTLTPTATPTYSQPASSAPVSSPPVYEPSSSTENSPVESSALVSSAPVYEPSSSTKNSPIESSVPEYAPSSSESSPVESEEVPPPAYTPKTHTYYSTAEVTITSCGAEVTDCPASSTVVLTTSTPVISVETTPASTPYSPVTESAGSPPVYSAPVESESASSPYSPITTSAAGSPPGYSAPAGSAPAASSPAAPEGGSTAPPAQTAPVTTVTYSQSVEVPATYTEGVSQGYEIPDSTYTTQLVTTITVPQVAMTTVTLTQDGQETTSVGLGAGSPAPAPATPTADAVGGYGAGPTGSAGFGTTYVPGPTASGAPIEQYGNSGVKVGSSIAGIIFGAVAVVMAF